MTAPPFKGGQGRSDESIERDAMSLLQLWCWVIGTAAVLALGLWAAGQAGGGS